MYETIEKRLKAIKTKGKILTFKERFYPRGTSENGNTQIIVTGVRKDKSSGAIKIEGQGYDSPWFNNTEDLFNAIDWDWMESAHGMGESIRRAIQEVFNKK